MAKHFGDVKDAMKMFSDVYNTHKDDNKPNEHNIHSDNSVCKVNNAPNVQYISNDNYVYNDDNMSKADIQPNTHNMFSDDNRWYVHNDDSAFFRKGRNHESYP